ncbi:MAG: hypothetical protein JSR25_10085, partial [Proteobacteria bacterium]|nr:hypothetical protein [Pseudomonadota bacterium]
MRSPFLFFAAIAAIIIWSRLMAAARKANMRAMAGGPQPDRSARSRSTLSSPSQETHMNPVSAVIFIIFVGGAVLSYLAQLPIGLTILLALIGIFLGYSVKMAQQWEKAVILRLGKLHSVKGPGLFILVPIVDQVAMWIDQRIRTTEFGAEQAL